MTWLAHPSAWIRESKQPVVWTGSACSDERGSQCRELAVEGLSPEMQPADSEGCGRTHHVPESLPNFAYSYVRAQWKRVTSNTETCMLDQGYILN